MTNFSNMDDVIDVRDVIERIDELESEIEDYENLESDPLALTQHEDNKIELAELLKLMADMKGYAGDEQWRGDWYPITLIRDSHFKDYAQELAEDLGYINPKVTWPYTCIDWDQAARELQYDYTSVDFNKVTYWFR